MLLLLLLPANRTGSAWLVWLPILLVVAATGSVLRVALAFLPSELLDLVQDAVRAQTIGIASVWLLANHLGRSHRVVSFLGLLVTMAAFSALTYLVEQGLQNAGIGFVQVAMLLGLSALAMSAALSLAGRSCRRRYRPAVLTVWLMIWLLALWLVIIIPFFLIALVSSGVGLDALGELLAAILTLAGINFATLLPFLMLSFLSPFFRERLKGLIHLGQEPPPIITAMPASSPA